MYVISAYDIEHAWHRAKNLLKEVGIQQESRVGPVLVSPKPVITHYLNPTRRVLQDPVRDANPFFHLMESLWMLNGSNDVAWVTKFNKGMLNYSDDGKTFHGAYGYRWRHHFDLMGGGGEAFTDQIEKAITCLIQDPTSRRVVVQMWDPVADLWSPDDVALSGAVPKDLPCNTAIYFDTRDGKLNMSVTNRSNDIVWGCYGANTVHMSVLQEYVAAMVGVEVGWYSQYSHNWHAYLNVWEKQDFKPVKPPGYAGTVMPLVEPRNQSYFDFDLNEFFELIAEDGEQHPDNWSTTIFHNQFFNHVAWPMAVAWAHYKDKDLERALAALEASRNTDNDWILASSRWIKRRMNNIKPNDSVLGVL